MDPRTVSRQIVDLSSIKALLMQMPGMMRAQQSQLEADLSPEFADAVSDALAKGFEFDALYNSLVETFIDRFDQEKVSKILTWFNSPLAGKLRNLELESLTPDAQRQLATFSDQLASNPPSSQRLALIKQIIHVADTGNFLAELDIALFRGVATVMDQLRSPARRLGPTKIEDIANSMRSTSRSRLEQLEQEVLTSMLFTYRTLSDDELQRYLGFLETAEGQWLDKTLNDGIVRAVEKASERATQELLPVVERMLNN